MIRRAVFIFCLLICAAELRASDSLYDPASARRIGNNWPFNFGPLSSHFRYDKRMIRAAEIAAQRARRHSSDSCWRYVKDALLDARVIAKRPETAYAKQ